MPGSRIGSRATTNSRSALTEVLTVIYLLFNEGYLSSTAERVHSRDLVDDAEWLTALLHGLLPNEPEVAGLLALIRLHRARTAARFTTTATLSCSSTRTAPAGTTPPSPTRRPC